MRKAGCDDLRLLGGEPAMYPDITGVCAAASKIGYKSITIFTNGTCFAGNELASQLKKYGLDRANVSIHSHKPEVHDKITGVKGSFYRMLSGLDSLRRAGVRISFICVVNFLNATELNRTTAFFLNKGISGFTFFFTKYQGRMVEEPTRSDKLSISMSEAAAVVKKALGVFRRHKMPLPGLEHFLPCVLPGYVRLMTDYFPAEAGKPDTGYLVHPDGITARVYATAYKGRRWLETCSRCRFRRGCCGIDPGYLAKFGSREFKPVKK